MAKSDNSGVILVEFFPSGRVWKRLGSLIKRFRSFLEVRSEWGAGFWSKILDKWTLPSSGPYKRTQVAVCSLEYKITE